LNHVLTQTQAIKDLGSKNKTLTAKNLELLEANDWLHSTRTGVVRMCWDIIEKKKLESQRQVTNLKELLTRPALEKASLVTQSKQDAQFRHYCLAKLQIEKNLVVKLKADLEAATMTGIPIPESIDDLAASIEQIINCTTKKGTHLATKVKIICESILTTVFDRKCLSYLVDRTFRRIQGENPYQRAIEIAKIIDLSGSLIN
jgi:hypothetical protein